MSDPFSKRLLDSYQSRARVSYTPYSTYQRESISAHGPTSFNPTMRGTYHPQDAFSCTPNDSAFYNLSSDTEAKLATLQAKLNQKLGPEYISTRPGGNGMKLTYTEGWKVINLANEVFGFNGWSTAVVNVTCDFADYDPNTQRHTIGIAAIVRVTLRDGVYHEDIGYGMMENSKSKAAAFDKVRSTPLIPRCLRGPRSFHAHRRSWVQPSSVGKRPSLMPSSVPCVILEISWETAFMTKNTPKKYRKSSLPHR